MVAAPAPQHVNRANALRCSEQPGEELARHRQWHTTHPALQRQAHLLAPLTVMFLAPTAPETAAFPTPLPSFMLFVFQFSGLNSAPAARRSSEHPAWLLALHHALTLPEHHPLPVAWCELLLRAAGCMHTAGTAGPLRELHNPSIRLKALNTACLTGCLARHGSSCCCTWVRSPQNRLECARCNECAKEKLACLLNAGEDRQATGHETGETQMEGNCDEMAVSPPERSSYSIVPAWRQRWASSELCESTLFGGMVTAVATTSAR